MLKNLNHNGSVLSFCSSEMQSCHSKGTHPSSWVRSGGAVSHCYSGHQEEALKPQGIQEPGSHHPEIHSWYLSQAIPLRMGSSNYLACHTRSQIKNFFRLQKSVPSLSWGGFPDYKHLFSEDSSLFISHLFVTGSSDFCYPGRSSFRQAQHASCKSQSHSKKQHPTCKAHCYRQVSPTDICPQSCVAKQEPLSSLWCRPKTKYPRESCQFFPCQHQGQAESPGNSREGSAERVLCSQDWNPSPVLFAPHNPLQPVCACWRAPATPSLGCGSGDARKEECVLRENGKALPWPMVLCHQGLGFVREGRPFHPEATSSAEQCHFTCNLWGITWV